MIRFPFQLTPVPEVKPWGPERRLHWFALTDGQYWINLGDVQLLRYAPETLSESALLGTPQYADYYVARFWEDLLQLLPSALEPVPDDLTDFLASDPAAWAWSDDERADAAISWFSDHFLDVGYLRRAPSLRWQRRLAEARDTVTLTWEHLPGDIEWDAPRAGQVSVPASEFITAVEELDRTLIAAMDERVSRLERTGPPPGVRADIPALRAEQQNRAMWLQCHRDRDPETNWAEVRSGAAILLDRAPASSELRTGGRGRRWRASRRCGRRFPGRRG